MTHTYEIREPAWCCYTVTRDGAVVYTTTGLRDAQAWINRDRMEDEETMTQTANCDHCQYPYFGELPCPVCAGTSEKEEDTMQYQLQPLIGKYWGVTDAHTGTLLQRCASYEDAVKVVKRLTHEEQEDTMNQTQPFGFDYCELCDTATPVTDMRPGRICARCDDDSVRRAFFMGTPLPSQPTPASEQFDAGSPHPCPCCYAGFIERYDEGKIPCDVCSGTGVDPLASGDLIGDRAIDADETCPHGINVYAYCAACALPLEVSRMEHWHITRNGMTYDAPVYYTRKEVN